MKSAEQIEQSIRRLRIEAGAEGRERTLSDLVAAHTRQGKSGQASGLRRFGRTVMRQRQMRIAAVVALAVLLVGAFGLGTGSVAFSQAGHAVNTTLAWLKSMIVGGPVGHAPAVSPQENGAAEQTPDPNRKAVGCAARFFKVSEGDEGLWQSLRDQGIELVRVSLDPEVYYTTLTREQARSFDASITLKCFAAPGIMVWDGESGAISVKDTTPQGPRGLAVGWLPMVTSDGKEVQSTISFHDGRSGFEIPNVRTEVGGAVLIRARGLFQGMGDGTSPEMLIRVLVEVR